MNNFFIASEVDRDRNGNIVRETNYTYDENGNLVRINIPLRNLFGSTTTFTYDENNNLIRETESFISNTFTSSSTINYTYDENGNLLTESGFTNNTFTNTIEGEYFTRYSYDERNNLILQSIDDNTVSSSGGEVDRKIEFTYDNRDNLLSQINTQVSSGNSITVKTYEYDENNNLITESEDTDFDGNLDTRMTYEYDVNNNLIVENSDFDLDGIADNTTTNTYDENNNLVVVEFETNSEFRADFIITNTYDENNNLITSTLDENRDGTIENTTANTYIQIGGANDSNNSNLSLTEVHRFYQHELGFHLYSVDDNEIESVIDRSDLGELAYTYEGEQYRVLSDNRDKLTGEVIEGSNPIYRFFNTETGAHLYTTDEVEKDVIESNLPNYNFEGIKYYAFESDPENIETIPVYRLLNSISGSHLYSSDTNEINSIEQNLPHFVTENNGDAVFYVVEL